MSKLQLTKAKRQKLKAAIAFMGASGSGKTHAALMTAYGLMKKTYPDASEEDRWEKVGVLDTEHRRSLYFAEQERAGVQIGQFIHIDLQAPFTPERYAEGIQMLIGAGCEVIVIDSVSHAWAKEGGLLDIQQNYGGRYQDWAKTNKHEAVLHKSLFENPDVHIITTMRTKQEYDLSPGDTGKLQVTKLGTKPIQRDDIEYEFMLTFLLDQQHVATAAKDNTHLYDGMQGLLITPHVGEELYGWLEQGVDIRKQEREAAEKAEAHRQAVIQEIISMGENNADVAKITKDCLDKLKKNSLNEVTNIEWVERIRDLCLQKLQEKADAEKKTKTKEKGQ